MSVTVGGRLAGYEILARLGQGGMGEVWRARDARLDREVAIKVLPPALAGDPEALARFEREAKAVAALSHPNILAIYDFGREGEIAYAAMELLDGETLGSLLAAGALPPRKALQIAAQVARGLAAAHERGVVHRDLKPDNLYVTRDGQVKILDFGLARRDEGPHGSKSQLLAAATLAPGTPATAPGTVLGTVGYMSPEQVRGELADHRSDLFSLGVVLYEMLTGRRAFARDSAVETMSAILKEDPPELETLGGKLSPAIARTLHHSLEKAPGERFQSARDFAFELQSLAAGGPSSSDGERTSSVAGRRSRRDALRLVAIGFAGVALGGIAATLWTRGGAPVDAPLRPSFRQLTKLPGGEGHPSVTPDGESFVFVRRDGDDLDLFVQRVDGTKSIALTADCEHDDSDPAFSPDGRWIAYRSDCDGGGVFVMGATGESRRRVADFGYWPAWSPDGGELAVVTERLEAPTSRNSTSELWAVRVDSGARRRVSEHDAMAPTWSPDGRRIAFWGLRRETFQRDIWSVAADGSQLAADAALGMLDDPELDWAPVYSADGRWLYFASTRGGTFNLWRLPLDRESGGPGGPPEPLTAPSSWAGPFALSADGHRLVFTDRNIESSIVRAPYDPVRRRFSAPPATAFSGSFELREQKLSPDGGQLLFVNEDLPQQLHLVRSDGSGYRQLTLGNDRNRQGDWSPDGQWIAFQTSSGDSSLAVIRPDGGSRELVPIGRGLSTPRWSPDGTTISAFDFSGGGGFLVDVRAGFSQPQVRLLPPVADGLLFWPVSWSPDGTYLAGRAARSGRAGEVVVRVNATGEYRTLAGTAGATNDFSLAFLDATTIVYTDDWGLWTRGLADQEPASLYRPAAGRRVESLSATADGRWVSWIEKADESDIWLMSLDEAAAAAPAEASRP